MSKHISISGLESLEDREAQIDLLENYLAFLEDAELAAKEAKIYVHWFQLSSMVFDVKKAIMKLRNN